MRTLPTLCVKNRNAFLSELQQYFDTKTSTTFEDIKSWSKRYEVIRNDKLTDFDEGGTLGHAHSPEFEQWRETIRKILERALKAATPETVINASELPIFQEKSLLTKQLQPTEHALRMREEATERNRVNFLTELTASFAEKNSSQDLKTFCNNIESWSKKFCVIRDDIIESEGEKSCVIRSGKLKYYDEGGSRGFKHSEAFELWHIKIRNILATQLLDSVQSDAYVQQCGSIAMRDQNAAKILKNAAGLPVFLELEKRSKVMKLLDSGWAFLNRSRVSKQTYILHLTPQAQQLDDEAAEYRAKVKQSKAALKPQEQEPLATSSTTRQNSMSQGR